MLLKASILVAGVIWPPESSLDLTIAANCWVYERDNVSELSANLNKGLVDGGRWSYGMGVMVRRVERFESITSILVPHYFPDKSAIETLTDDNLEFNYYAICHRLWNLMGDDQ